jgi:hypothetical protein
MLAHLEPLPDRLVAARPGLEALLQTRAAAIGESVSAEPEAGFRHWGDTPQWYDWHKR